MEAASDSLDPEPIHHPGRSFNSTTPDYAVYCKQCDMCVCVCACVYTLTHTTPKILQKDYLKNAHFLHPAAGLSVGQILSRDLFAALPLSYFFYFLKILLEEQTVQ